MKKLVKGDYTPNLTKKQFEELMDFQPNNYRAFIYNPPNQSSVIWNGDYLSVYLKNEMNELTFEEFKERAINTFRQGEKEESNPTMKTYHVVWFPHNQDVYSTGVNIEAESMLEALAAFIKDYNVEPFYIAQKD